MKKWQFRLQIKMTEPNPFVQAVEALKEFQIPHEHNESNSNYRPLGDNYGWCCSCQTKVGLNEDYAREVLKALEPYDLAAIPELVAALEHCLANMCLSINLVPLDGVVKWGSSEAAIKQGKMALYKFKKEDD